MTRFVRLAEDGIKIGLAAPDDGFDGPVGEKRMMTLEDEAVPEAARAPVPVFKRMEELHFVFADRRANRRRELHVRACTFRQRIPKIRHLRSRRRDMSHLVAFGNTNTSLVHQAPGCLTSPAIMKRCAVSGCFAERGPHVDRFT